ncbi:MAG: TRAP transporter small permease subunit, partial [Myxococcales bacterium]|nr:TRAP transporter small permease subunit [Myxococcales bacterium]
MSRRGPPSERSPRAPRPAAWAESVARLDASWQRLEARLCAAVLLAEIASLFAWISLKGLSADLVPGGNAAGVVYRAIVTAALLGTATHLAFRPTPGNGSGAARHRVAVTAAVVAGAAAARLWAHAGVGWSSNALNWLQNASVLMLVGGLRGLATRLTLWLALIGASLATSRGKHIHVDVVVRRLPAALRTRVTVLGWLVAAGVCAAAVVGFVDYIGIAEYRASAVEPCPGDPGRTCDAPAGAKRRTIARGVSADLFLLGRQASLDVRSLPRVLAGRPYDRWMTAADWNAWLEGADWAAHFGRAAETLRMDPFAPAATRTPQVSVPGTGEQ